MNKKILFLSCALFGSVGLSACGNNTPQESQPEAEKMASVAQVLPVVDTSPFVSVAATASPTSLTESIPEDEIAEMIDSLWGGGTSNNTAEEEEDEEAIEEDILASPTASPKATKTITKASVSPKIQATKTEDAASKQYNDGVYRATGSYQGSNGNENIEVEIVVEDDKVMNISITPRARSAAIRRIQEQFADEIGALVIGRKLEDIDKLSSVSDSDQITDGFAKAVQKIRDEAAI